MPRVNGIMQPLPNVYGQPGGTIGSAKYNSQLDDLIADANAPRPVTAGGTGSNNPGAAREALGVPVAIEAARSNAITTVRGDIDEPRNTLRKLLDWTVDRLAEKLGLAGGRMTGPLRLAPASFVQIEDSNDGRYTWLLDSSNLLFGAYWNAEQGLGAAGYKFQVDRNGKVTTAELGDLKTYLDQLAATAAADATTKTNTRMPLAGGSFTGDVAMNKANPIFRMINTGVRSWTLQALGSNLRIVDDTGAYEHTTFEPDGNILFRAVPNGVGAIRLDVIAARALRGSDARTLVDTKFERLRLTGSFSSETNGGYDAPAGGVITGYSREEGAQGRVGNIRGKYLQGWSLTNGWVNAINEG